MEETKRCTRCGNEYPTERFYRSFNKRLGAFRWSSWCRTCHSEAQLRSNKKREVELREYRRVWANQDRKKRYAKYRVYEIRKKLKLYGLPADWYEKQFEKQGGVCAICKQPEMGVHSKSGTPLPLSIDHDHGTTIARGLLCWKCNTALHRAERDPQWLINAVAYLKENQR